VDIPFDPFDLTVYPSHCPGLHRANAFMSGILFNRIAFDIAKGREIGEIQSVDYLEKLDNKIKNIDKNSHFLNKYLESSNAVFDWLIDQIEELKNLRKRKEDKKVKFEDQIFFSRSRNLSKEYLQLEISNRFLKAKESASVLKKAMGSSSKFFDLGLIVDGATHSCHVEERSVDKCRFKEIKKTKVGNIFYWVKDEGQSDPFPFTKSLYDGPDHFFTRLQYESTPFKFPFDIQKSNKMPTPEEWGIAIVEAWNNLATLDRLECGFERVQLDGGMIYLDGSLVGKIGPRTQPYLALRYMVAELQRSKERYFNSSEIFSAIYKWVPKQTKKKKDQVRVTSQQFVQGKRTNSRKGKPVYAEFGNIYRRLDGKIQKIFPRIYQKDPKQGFSIEIKANPQAFLV